MTDYLERLRDMVRCDKRWDHGMVNQWRQLHADTGKLLTERDRLLALVERAEVVIDDWLYYADECLSEFDVEGDECEIESESDLCHRCRQAGCIQLKIRNARALLSKLTAKEQSHEG